MKLIVTTAVALVLAGQAFAGNLVFEAPAEPVVVAGSFTRRALLTTAWSVEVVLRRPSHPVACPAVTRSGG